MTLLIKRFEALTTLELYRLMQVRISVFVVEQSCPYQEADEKDLSAYHVFFQEGDAIEAYLRVMPPAQGSDTASIGRVLTVNRGSGLGRAIMEAGIGVARDTLKARQVYLEAQSYAIGFYRALGFVQTSEEFLEDGIPHVKMLLTL